MRHIQIILMICGSSPGSTTLARMRHDKMAEGEFDARFEAPLANFDMDEWNDYNDFQSTTDLQNINGASDSIPEATDNRIDNFSDVFSGSLEDLVNSFDEKITKCFCTNEKTEEIAPVQVRTQEEIMSDCQ